VTADVFQICRNVFNETVDGKVCIAISSAQYPGPMALRIYNSVGEHITTLFDQNLTQPLAPTVVTWDGTNKYGQKVASGVYIVYLIKPFGRATGRLVVLQ
jgi:flagellar hook assembly protein FlgD